MPRVSLRLAVFPAFVSQMRLYFFVNRDKCNDNWVVVHRSFAVGFVKWYGVPGLRSGSGSLVDRMRLPIFIVGLFVAVAVSAAIGMAAGFESSQLVLFVIVVTVALQLAYVLVVALLAAEHSRKSKESQEKAPASNVSQERDAG